MKDEIDLLPVEHATKKKKREICDRCHRPKPRACLCHSLPDLPLELSGTKVVILQHPQELQRKNNRSVPLLELCLRSSDLHLCVGKRLGDQIPADVQKLLQPPNLVVLVFPETKEEESADGTLFPVLSLTELNAEILEWRKQQIAEEGTRNSQVTAAREEDSTALPKVVLLVLDATWKFAQEMHRKNVDRNQYPSHMLRVALRDDDLPPQFQPRRFVLRTTPRRKKPSPRDEDEEGDDTSWMCTAECVAWILSRLEQEWQPQNAIYETVLKVIDAQVEIHNSFLTQKKPRISGKDQASSPDFRQ